MPVITPRNKNSHLRSNYSVGFFFFFFFSIVAAPRWPPYTNHYRQCWQPHNWLANITEHQNTNKIFFFFFFFFSLEGVLVTIEQEQNNSMEFFEGTARVGLAHVGSAAVNKKTQLPKNQNKL
jgi:hypothetical protein